MSCLSYVFQGRDSMYDNVHGMGVDPRNIAQRIMEVSAARMLLCSRASLLASTIVSNASLRSRAPFSLILVASACVLQLHFAVIKAGAEWLQIRKQLATEWMSDLKGVSEENASLLRESLSSSLEKMFAAPVTIASDDEGERVHPDMVDDQAID